MDAGCEGVGRKPRQLRLEYRGVVYHGMNRRGRRKDNFHGDEDRRLFLSTLSNLLRKAKSAKSEVTSQ